MSNIDIDKITLEHIPEGLHRELAKVIGIENLLAVTDLIGGDTVYIMRREALTRSVRNQLIAEEFDGGNYTDLAKKYGVTTQWVRQIVKAHG